MSLLIALIGFFIIKIIFLIAFYIKQWKELLKVVFFSSMAIVPLITILYHETPIDFLNVYIAMILLDILILNMLVQYNWWKAVPASLLANTIGIIFFFLGNG